MADPTLIQRAEAAGIAPEFRDWRGRQVAVSEQTLAAILDALDSVPDLPRAAGADEPGPDEPGADEPGADEPGADEHCNSGARAGAGAAARPRLPARRSWGFTVQLYSVRSRRSWGHGDLRDLADLATWSGRELGADFVLVNPLHAAEPVPPVSPSPYLPMSRSHVSPLYLRIEDIPEYAALGGGDRARIDRLAAPLRAASATAALIDRDAVWAAKREALEII